MLTLESLVSHHMSLNEALASDSPVAYALGGNGIMVLHRTTWGRLGVRMVNVPIPNLPDLPPYIIEWDIPKIPIELFNKALYVLKNAYQLYRAESLILICYHRKRYFLHVPPQEVTAASVDYKLDIPSEQVIMHIHSHPGSLNSFSLIDDKDELNAGLYVVLSNIGSSWPSANISLAIAGYRVNLTSPDDLAQIFAMPSDINDAADLITDRISIRKEKPIKHYKQGAFRYNGGLFPYPNNYDWEDDFDAV